MPPRPARRTTGRFIQTPVDLVLAFRARPRTAAVYALLARLCEVARGPVALSRDDLALLFDATRDDPVGVGIERAIRDLRASGWLIHTNQGQRGKRQLLVTWGLGRDKQPRTWRFERPDRGRPASMAVVRVPLALFDHYLGRLIIQADAPAQVERYLSAPLLTLNDISTFMTRQIGAVPPTPRLAQLDLVNDVPELGDLLARAATGDLMSDETTPVVLTPAGERQLERCRAAYTSPGDAHHGSRGDPCAAPHGSRDGSQAAAQDKALESAKSSCKRDAKRAWDVHGKKKQTKKDSLSHELSHDVYSSEEGQYNEIVVADQDEPIQATHSLKATTPKYEHIAATCDISHEAHVDPQVATAHQLLNADRAISAAEWWALAQLQQEQGATAVLRWQRRAIAAGRTQVTLQYYEACAAAAACDKAGRHGADTAPPKPKRVTQAPHAPPPPPSAEHRAVIACIAERAGMPIRYPEKLAAVPLPLLQRWCAVAAHPGLHAKGDPIAMLVHGASRGKEPPAVAELNRWAEQRGTHWSQLTAWQPADQQPARLFHEPAAAQAAPPAHLEPPLLPARDLQSALQAHLRCMRPRAAWPLIDALQVGSTGDHVIVSWATPQQLAQAQATLVACLRSALDDLGERRSFKLAIAARTAPVALPE